MYYYDDSIEGQFILLRSSLSGTPIDSEAEERIRKEAESDMRIHYHEKNDDSIGGRFILLKSLCREYLLTMRLKKGLEKKSKTIYVFIIMREETLKIIFIKEN